MCISQDNGLDAYTSGDLTKARNIYEKLHRKVPDSDAIKFALGTTAFRQKDENTAKEYLSSVRSSNDPTLASKAYYNLGKLFTDENDFKNGLLMYKKAIILDPNDKDAKINYELLKRKIQEPRQPRPRQPRPKQPRPRQPRPRTTKTKTTKTKTTKTKTTKTKTTRTKTTRTKTQDTRTRHKNKNKTQDTRHKTQEQEQDTRHKTQEQDNKTQDNKTQDNKTQEQPRHKTQDTRQPGPRQPGPRQPKPKRTKYKTTSRSNFECFAEKGKN